MTFSLQDVPYKPEELYVKTRNCEPDAGANIVQYCERQVVPLVSNLHLLAY